MPAVSSSQAKDSTPTPADRPDVSRSPFSQVQKLDFRSLNKAKVLPASPYDGRSTSPATSQGNFTSSSSQII